MALSSRQTADLHDLLWQLRSGLATPEQLSSLERLVCEEREARAFYVRYVHLCADLHWNGSAKQELGGREPEITGGDWESFVQESHFSPAEAELPEFPSPPPITVAPPPSITSHPSLFTAHGPLSGNFVGGPVFSYMVASVVLCLMLLGGWAYKITHVDPARSAVVGQENQNSPLFVGRVTGMKDCVWPEDALMTMPGASVPMGRKYSLDSGLLEITYASGARVILEGPCSYTVDSAAGGFLRVGKLVARVEKKVASGQWPVARKERRGEREEGRDGLAASATSAKPQATNPEYPVPNSQSPLSTLHSPLFTIATPTAIVTDLGTEFGVEVGESGTTFTHVFRGSVEMKLIHGDPNGGMVLHENESAGTNDPGVTNKISLVKFDDNYRFSFVRSMPTANRRDDDAFAATVLSLNPALYLRMTKPAGEGDQRQIRDYAPGGNHGLLILGDEYGGLPYRPGLFGDALSLRGPDAKDYVLIRNYPKARDNKLTIATWVFATGRPGWAMIAANWGHQSAKGQFHFGLHQLDGDLSVSISQRDGKQLDLREGSEQPFPLFDWQFVAFVADSDTVKLYRNGNLVASAASNGIYADTPLSTLGVGCRTNDEGTGAPAGSPGYHYWQGRIDELAIFNQSLTNEQINQLFTGKQIDKMPPSAAARKGGEPVDGP